MIEDVAALYVEALGPYPKLCAHWYDEVRDARKYAGPWPIVAHPPCGPWGALRHLYEGREHDCAPWALSQIHAFGGVLEHPAKSKFWEAAGLPAPGTLNDYNGFTIEVDQCAWGHVARKTTWLYFYGVERELVLSGVKTGGTPTHWVSGSRGKTSRSGLPVPPGIKVCSATQRRRTPLLFAAWLLSLARTAKVKHDIRS